MRIELVEGAIAVPEFRHPERALYLFAPNNGTLRQKVIDRADRAPFSRDYKQLIRESRDVNYLVMLREVGGDSTFDAVLLAVGKLNHYPA